MPISRADLTIRESLTILTIRGFRPEDDGSDGDNPGSETWFCDQYGMSDQYQEGPGILWTSCESSSSDDRDFSALVDGTEADDVKGFAIEAGYEILSAEPVTEPTRFGDGHAGTVEILKHRDGWVVLS